MKKEFVVKSENELASVVQFLLTNYPNGAVVLLNGTLGAGKSTLVSYFARSLGLDSSSPTFGILHHYREDFLHFDLYRVGSDGFFSRGLFEEIRSGWVFFEWADQRIVEFVADQDYTLIRVDIELQNDIRIYKIESF